mmetsp:Transcript_75635/g.130995  ORF Transcript_75635/g.130995 Transcript_75635/m.130995 type:complete len:113 (+) Transcript_75635:153-491(+)
MQHASMKRRPMSLETPLPWRQVPPQAMQQDLATQMASHGRSEPPEPASQDLESHPNPWQGLRGCPEFDAALSSLQPFLALSLQVPADQPPRWVEERCLRIQADVGTALPPCP